MRCWLTLNMEPPCYNKWLRKSASIEKEAAFSHVQAVVRVVRRPKVHKLTLSDPSFEWGHALGIKNSSKMSSILSQGYRSSSDSFFLMDRIMVNGLFILAEHSQLLACHISIFPQVYPHHVASARGYSPSWFNWAWCKSHYIRILGRALYDVVDEEADFLNFMARFATATTDSGTVREVLATTSASFCRSLEVAL